MKKRGLFFLIIFILFSLIFISKETNALPPPSQNIVDSDLDGIDDSWELGYFATLDETADEDFDKDGFTNLEEFSMSTNPKVSDLDEAYSLSSTLIIIALITVIVITGIIIFTFIYGGKSKKRKQYLTEEDDEERLINYVKACRKRRISDEEIKNKLLEIGWQEDVVNEVLQK